MAAPQDNLVRDQQFLLHSLHRKAAQQHAHVWCAGQGALLYDDAGREFLDAIAGLWNVVVGHGREELGAAAARQMSQLAYASSYAGSTNRPAIELAERLAAICYPHINRFYFTSGGRGSERKRLQDGSLLLATCRQAWQVQSHRPNMGLSRHDAGGHVSDRNRLVLACVRAAHSRLLAHREPLPLSFSAGTERPRTPGQQAADLLEAMILREGADTVGAFLGEPVQGAGGVIVPPDDYWPRIRQICDRHDVLLITDEVITGFGRTGDWFGLTRYGVEPDIVTFAKGITSGYFPMGGIGVSDKIAETIDTAPKAKCGCTPSLTPAILPVTP